MNPKDFLTSACGVQMPRIIYGTAWKKDATAALVEQAIGLGFRGIDTACQPKHYNEAGVGDGVAACLHRGIDRSELYLQSKFTPLSGQDPMSVPYDPNAGLGGQVAQSFQASLKNLQTTYLDCLVLHSPLANPPQTMEAWRAMEQIVHSGGVKQLGISNCYDFGQFERLYRDAEIKPAVIQNRFYAETGYDRAIRNFCREHGVIYQSFWTLTANPGVLSHPTLKALAVKYRRSAAQIFFRYLSQIGIIPLTGTTSEIHMREDLALFDFELAEGECDAVETLL
ncbi:aldo/keto reductase [Methylobacter sp. Wu8]|uniref:Diketogulonate reductase-like aldo/keto reductase n=1 Tax=Methylobacter tundripaludum TaxID=173365 RepID=A0A2S6H8R4_9GAMM|nr:aldo/keto reductase [Methylobacter tundripaludum]MCF7965115.1 aldo/keto reductase [Methylobacter tundripaludum]MCK9636805.1 aldo/keto reductase [Methylobacter tundripaludum]PPK73793.1 diketogulonate reductase-like aldo/keto reductase [Methylobacter tundripaludum]